MLLCSSSISCVVCMRVVVLWHAGWLCVWYYGCCCLWWWGGGGGGRGDSNYWCSESRGLELEEHICLMSHSTSTRLLSLIPRLRRHSQSGNQAACYNLCNDIRVIAYQVAHLALTGKFRTDTRTHPSLTFSCGP